MNSLVLAPTCDSAIICSIKLVGLDRPITHSTEVYSLRDPHDPDHEAYFQIHYINNGCHHWSILTDGEIYAFMYRNASNELRKYMISTDEPPIPPISEIVKAISRVT